MGIENRRDAFALGFALISATLMIAQQVAGKATRDALFLSQFDVVHLPKVVMAAAILSFFGVLLMSRLLGRISPATLVPPFFTLSAGLFWAEWSWYPHYPAVVSVTLYFHMASFGLLLISGVWSVINERFDPHMAKRIVARVTAAATLGGVLGGVVAAQVSGAFGNRAMLLVLAGIHAACALGVLGIGRPRRHALRDPAIKASSGLRVIRRLPYLQQMAILMALTTLVAALLDYALKAEAKAYYADAEALTAFFATFYAVVGVGALLLQTLIGPLLLRRFGLGGTIGVMPGVVLFGGVIATAVTHIWTVVILRGAEFMLANSLFRSAFELLYTPLTPDKKRPTKIIIDVAANRAGDVLGSGLLLLLLWWVPEVPNSLVISIAMGMAGIALFVAGKLNPGYVEQLAASLRQGSVSLEDDGLVDATTRRALAHSGEVSDRELLLERLRELEQGRAGGVHDVEAVGASETAAGALPAERRSAEGRAPDRAVAPPAPADPVAKPTEEGAVVRVEGGEARLLVALADLTSRDVARIRQTLTGRFMDLRLVSAMIPLLGHPLLGDEARMELRWLVPRITGQLTDALTDPDTPMRVRERLPEVLEVHYSPRVVQALMLGLEDGDFSVRFRCAQALARMTARSPNLEVPKRQVFAAARREVEVDARVWEEQGKVYERHGEFDADAQLTRAGLVNPSLYHVYTVLSLALDRDALRATMHAMVGDDPALRGTALEYLEHVLPDSVRKPLWRHIGAERGRKPRGGRSGRTRKAVRDELLRFSGTDRSRS